MTGQFDLGVNKVDNWGGRNQRHICDDYDDDVLILMFMILMTMMMD